MVCSAQSQSDQAIILSKPADDGQSSPASDSQLSPDSGYGQSLFISHSSADFSMPPPDVNTAWQKELNNRKNWTLMTPEEIMGVQTPEQIFGLSELDPEKKLSPEQRYLKREENATTAAATNAMAGNNIFSHKGFGLFDQPDADDPFSAGDGKKNGVKASDFSQIFGQSQNSIFGQKSRPSQFGPGTSSSPVVGAKEKLAEEAEMARFRALIGEVPQPGVPTTTPMPLSAPSPSLQPLSQFDPFGHPLASSQPKDLSQPTSVTPLTEYTGAYTPVKKAKKPSWEAQPPPWLSDGSTPPNGLPVRKF